MSFVLIEIDTSPPILSIYAPRYTTKDIVNTITIESNEVLSDSQEIYIIDGNGERHDYTFSRQEDGKTYVGRIRFFQFENQHVTLYVRMVDSVGNTSNLYSTTIEIKESLTLLQLDIKDYQMKLDNKDYQMKLDIKDYDRQ